MQPPKLLNPSWSCPVPPPRSCSVRLCGSRGRGLRGGILLACRCNDKEDVSDPGKGSYRPRGLPGLPA
eukprot:637554-Heterocapsa_arctica.AAC.1